MTEKICNNYIKKINESKFKNEILKGIFNNKINDYSSESYSYLLEIANKYKFGYLNYYLDTIIFIIKANNNINLKINN